MPRVFTEEQKQRNKLRLQEWRKNNREHCRERDRKNYKADPEKGRVRSKRYREKHPEKMKEYRQTLNGKKSDAISRWKQRGVVSSDYNLLYDNYLKSTNCEECGVEYGQMGDGTSTYRCLDHCHETGLFRNFICLGCNTKRR